MSSAAFYYIPHLFPDTAIWEKIMVIFLILSLGYNSDASVEISFRVNAYEAISQFYF